MWRLTVTNTETMVAHTTRHLFSDKETAEKYYDLLKEAQSRGRTHDNAKTLEIESADGIANVRVHNLQSVMLTDIRPLDGTKAIDSQWAERTAEVLSDILEKYGEKVAELYSGLLGKR